MARKRVQGPHQESARELQARMAREHDAEAGFVAVFLDPFFIRRCTGTGKIGSDGSAKAHRNVDALKAFHRRAMDLHDAAGVTDRVRHELVMAASELCAKRLYSPQDNVQSSKLLRAIDDLWYSMRAADDRALIGQIKKLAQDLCTFSSWPRSDWPGLA